MHRLSSLKNSFGSHQTWNKATAVTNVGAFVRRNIKTSTPVSQSFGRGYGLVGVKPLVIESLLRIDSNRDTTIRKMSITPRATRKDKDKEGEVAEETLKTKNLHPNFEKLEDITKDLVKLTDNEIQSILDSDATSIQTERGKTWLEQSMYAIRPVPDNKDLLMLTKKIGNTVVTVTFKKEFEEEEQDEDEDADPNEKEEGEEGTEDTEEGVAEKEQAEGQESWIRSGDELPDREDFPMKHSLEIDIRIHDKKDQPKGNFHLYGFAGLDDRLYINEMLCQTGDVATLNLTRNPSPSAVEKDADKTYCVFDDLSDAMQDRIYDYLDELGVDDRMAHFIKTTVMREKKESDIAFLHNFKQILKA